MDDYRILVTGSRDFKDVSILRSALVEARLRAGGRPMVIVQGGARGADALAAALAERSPEAVAETWPALWRRAAPELFPENIGPAGHSNPSLPPYYRDEALYQAEHAKWSRDYDPRAGHARNEAMLASGVEEVLAFLQEGAANKGTLGAIRAARRLGLPVREYTGRLT